jgi:hypothetical protein
MPKSPLNHDADLGPAGMQQINRVTIEYSQSRQPVLVDAAPRRLAQLGGNHLRQWFPPLPTISIGWRFHKKRTIFFFGISYFAHGKSACFFARRGGRRSWSHPRRTAVRTQSIAASPPQNDYPACHNEERSLGLSSSSGVKCTIRYGKSDTRLEEVRHAAAHGGVCSMPRNTASWPFEKASKEMFHDLMPRRNRCPCLPDTATALDN